MICKLTLSKLQIGRKSHAECWPNYVYGGVWMSCVCVCVCVEENDENRDKE